MLALKVGRIGKTQLSQVLNSTDAVFTVKDSDVTDAVVESIYT